MAIDARARHRNVSCERKETRATAPMPLSFSPDPLGRSRVAAWIEARFGSSLSKKNPGATEMRKLLLAAAAAIIIGALGLLAVYLRAPLETTAATPVEAPAPPSAAVDPQPAAAETGNADSAPAPSAATASPAAHTQTVGTPAAPTPAAAVQQTAATAQAQTKAKAHAHKPKSAAH
jgi:cytoskeletal protein RodZ